MRACFPHNQFLSSMTVSVYGGVEVYNEQSFCVKYRSQGVQTSFYESTPSASDSLGNTIPPGDIDDPGNARADFPNASEERNFQKYLQTLQGSIRNAFMVRNASGGWHPVIDLKQLNHQNRRSSLSHAHHKLSAEYCRKKGDYTLKIDLQDAYFHVLIHPHSRKYLRFAFENKVYQFRVLHFSLNTAPQVFTCLRHRVAAYRISSQKTLSYREVSQFMGSLNWASGLIPLGHLHLTSLQHFHSLGLTNRFSTPRRSDPVVLATLLRQWHNLSFLTSGIPI